MPTRPSIYLVTQLKLYVHLYYRKALDTCIVLTVSNITTVCMHSNGTLHSTIDCVFFFFFTKNLWFISNYDYRTWAFIVFYLSVPSENEAHTKDLESFSYRVSLRSTCRKYKQSASGYLCLLYD